MILILLSFFFFILVIYMVKSSVLQLKYSITWLLLSFIFIVVSIFPDILSHVKRIFDIETPINALYLLLIAMILLIIFTLTLIISKYSLIVRRLAQTIAIDKATYIKHSDVLIIVPAYNEIDSIVDVINDIRSSSSYDHIIINDCSTDDTLQTCLDNGLNVINLPTNLGIGGAVQTGYIYAKKQGYDIAIQFDGDGQHVAKYLSSLVAKVRSGYDLVIGSRFVEVGDGFKSTILRRFGIKYFMILIRVLTAKTITDATSGMRACSHHMIDVFADNYPTDYPEPESIIKTLSKGHKVVEVPVTMKERQGGKTSISFVKSIYYMVKVTIAIIIAKLGK